MRGYRRHWGWWAQLVREVWCILAGHDWRSSWRRVSDDFDWHRSQRGNPYYAHVASWRGKCRRCRLRTRSDTWYPFWRQLWWGVSGGIRNIDIAWECYAPWGKGTRRIEGTGYRVSSWRNVAILPLLNVVEVVNQVAAQIHDTRWIPPTPLWCLFDVEYWLTEKCEANTTYYDWLPPDGWNHGIAPPSGFVEAGLWVRRGSADPDPLKRTRVYAQVAGPTHSTTSTYGSTTTVSWTAA